MLQVIVEYERIIYIFSRVVLTSHDRYGKPITMDEYKKKFFSPEEGAPRAAVKRLTAQLEQQLTEITINAPDWLVLLRRSSLCLKTNSK